MGWDSPGELVLETVWSCRMESLGIGKFQRASFWDAVEFSTKRSRSNSQIDTS